MEKTTKIFLVLLCGMLLITVYTSMFHAQSVLNFYRGFSNPIFTYVAIGLTVSVPSILLTIFAYRYGMRKAKEAIKQGIKEGITEALKDKENGE